MSLLCFARKDIALVLFSPDGNFLQDLLIDEGVAAVDALSRAAVLQAVRALNPLGVPVAPLRFLLGDQLEERLLTREELRLNAFSNYCFCLFFNLSRKLALAS